MGKEKLGPLIALVGSDGSGKSTVGNALLAWLSESRPVAMCHLGKQTGDIGRKLRRAPLLGGRIDKALAKRGGRASAERGADAITAIFEYAFSMRRVWRFRKMMKIRRTGIAILADRYPQTSVLGARADGPHLVAANPKSWVTRTLKRRERRHYDRMASYKPTLVIRLLVDLETAARRKPDHRYESLAEKVDMVSRLSYQGAPIVEIDSRQPLETVLAQAKAAVADALARADAEASAQPG